MSLLKFEPKTIPEPIYAVNFNGLYRLNYPSLPSMYELHRDGIKFQSITGAIDTGVTYGEGIPLMMCVGFKVLSQSSNYGTIVGTSYLDESHKITRVITGTTTYNGYANINTSGAKSTPVSFDRYNINRVSLEADATSVGTAKIMAGVASMTAYSIEAIGTNVDSSNFRVGDARLVMILYELFIKVNNEIKANWVPCIRKTDSVAGFYDGVTRHFFTTTGLSAV